MSWLLLVLTVLWLVVAVHDLVAVRKLPSLPPLPPEKPPPADVTVVMAVRDDVHHVEESVRRLLAQQHVHLRLVVVDDRSVDGTGEVLARLAAREPRLRVVTVRELPPEWLGKSHALHLGAASVQTRWLLFTDGDAHLSPDTLARAIAAAEAANAQHVSLLPTHRRTSLLGRAGLLAFQLTVQRRVAAINAAKQRTFVGTGAFNLVRSDAYHQIGGHLPLRLEVVDDVWLGYLLFRASFRTRVWFAGDDFAIDWGGTPRELVRVVEKNMFAVLRYRTWLALLASFGGLGLLAATFAAPLYGGWLGWLVLASYLATGLGGVALAHKLHWDALAGLLVPFARVLLPMAMLNSTWVTLRQGGVRWRGTFYPLALLRRGQVH